MTLGKQNMRATCPKDKLDLKIFQHCDKNVMANFKAWVRLFKAELRKPRVSANVNSEIWKLKKQIQVHSFRLQFGNWMLCKE